MKMKWIVVPVILVGVAGVTGKFYEYVEKKKVLFSLLIVKLTMT